MSAIPTAPPLQLANLCKNCQVISFDDSDPRFRKIIEPGAGPPLSPTECLMEFLDYNVHDSLPGLPVLRKSAEDGCDFCRLLLYTLFSVNKTNVKEFLTQNEQQDVEISLMYWWLPPDNCSPCSLSPSIQLRALSLTATIRVLPLNPSLPSEASEIFLSFVAEGYTDYEEVARWLSVHCFRESLDRLDQETVTWAKSLLDTCAAEHTHQGTAEAFCPARLLDVRQEPVRLIERDHIKTPSSVSYAALSYCWGTAEEATQQLTTTNDTLEARRAGIPKELLSPVISDAIQVTRSLSIPYLWVDAICILQDNERDWEQQSSEMDKIYRNAYFTIATPASNSCLQGFRYSNNERILVPFRSRLESNVSGAFSLRYLSGLFPRHMDTNLHWLIYSCEVENSAWASRGWTFQEEVLSSRVLAFGSDEVFYTCGGVTHCYCGFDDGKLYTFSLYHKVRISNWHSIVSTYSLRAGYSRQSDILPALSGIAALFGREMGFHQDEYVAGLWKKTLFSDLVWYLGFENKAKSLASLLEGFESAPSYIAPSWAWLGRGLVCFVQGTIVDPHLSVCTSGAWTAVKGENPFGEVESGRVEIVGKVAELDVDLTRSSKPDSLSETQWVSKWKQGHRWTLDLDWEPSMQIDTIPWGKLKMVFTGRALDERHEEQRSFYGILVHETGSRDPENTYYRVGIFRSEFETSDPCDQPQQFFDRLETQTINII